MAASKLPLGTLSLKQFLLRRQVLTLYRKILRTLKDVPDEHSRKQLREWAREEFERNKHQKDEMAIKMMLSRGRQTHKEISSTLMIAKS